VDRAAIRCWCTTRPQCNNSFWKVKTFIVKCYWRVMTCQIFDDLWFCLISNSGHKKQGKVTLRWIQEFQVWKKQNISIENWVIWKYLIEHAPKNWMMWINIRICRTFLSQTKFQMHKKPSQYAKSKINHWKIQLKVAIFDIFTGNQRLMMDWTSIYGTKYINK
jgi:hypothetical protein